MNNTVKTTKQLADFGNVVVSAAICQWSFRSRRMSFSEFL